MFLRGWFRTHMVKSSHLIFRPHHPSHKHTHFSMFLRGWLRKHMVTSLRLIIRAPPRYTVRPLKVILAHLGPILSLSCSLSWGHLGPSCAILSVV